MPRQNIINGEIPAWYNLLTLGPVIGIDIYRPAFEWCQEKLQPEMPLIQGIKEQGASYGTDFTPLPFHCWGYGGCLQFRPEEADDGWERVLYPLPILKQFGRANQTMGYIGLASLAVLFMGLNAYEGPGDESKSQLITIDTLGFKQEIHGCDFSATYSPEFREYLKRLPPNVDLQLASASLPDAYRHMWRDGSPSAFKTRVTDSDCLHLEIEGAAGFDPASDTVLDFHRGYRARSHNAETPVHSLSLLAGLAALWHEASAELNRQVA